MVALSLLLFAAALAPDRPAAPEEWGYRPEDGATVAVNPPAMTWVHEPTTVAYAVEWADNASFRNATTVRRVKWPAYTHSAPLKPGTWYWRYRLIGTEGQESAWSVARRFIIPKDAVEFPQPPLDELVRRVPRGHPRVFLRREDLPALKAYAAGAGRTGWEELVSRADALVAGEPTPEPTVRADQSDPATNQYWWSNRVQTIRAAHEAEILAFVFLLTGEDKYKDAARRYILALAKWDPDGPTNFKLNCEAAKPLVHRLARAYDWGYDALNEDERRQVRAVMLRRGLDAWNSWEAQQGSGHLNRPYGSHANRLWHKLAENAVATLGETPEAEEWLDFAVTKFFATYPVWSDQDGGWHEGLSYMGSYVGRAAWWMELARTPLGIDAFLKPFYRKVGDYVLYSAPPGSPDLGIADLSFRPPGQGWAFLHYYARRTGNGYWPWWLEQWGVASGSDDPVFGFLWSSLPPVALVAPVGLPVSKVFRDTGIAVLNTTLMNSADNVQVRFKSSPMGRWSHGHDPQNSFTLNAYGEPLLVNNVYRDLYGTPFHKGWVWSTRAQNALLVNGEGQKPHAKDAVGRIVQWQIEDGFDYVLGDAAPAYDGRLTKAFRHVLFVKPDLVIFVDEAESPAPTTFQWMLHGQKPFDVEESAQRLRLERDKAGVEVVYAASRPLKLRQWTGYDPPPDYRYLNSIKSPGIPEQWHVEAASTEPEAAIFTLTIARVYRPGQVPAEPVRVERRGNLISVRAGGSEARFHPQGPEFAEIRNAGKSWNVRRPPTPAR